ncbi:hypothetical protein Tco_0489066 [Tanacetum coccineum]
MIRSVGDSWMTFLKGSDSGEKWLLWDQIVTLFQRFRVIVMVPKLASPYVSDSIVERKIVNNILTRLSKWKLKTLSIGGSLTLLKSVLEAIWVKWNKVFGLLKKRGRVLEFRVSALLIELFYSNGFGVFAHNNLLYGPKLLKGYMEKTERLKMGIVVGGGTHSMSGMDKWRGDINIQSDFHRIAPRADGAEEL